MKKSAIVLVLTIITAFAGFGQTDSPVFNSFYSAYYNLESQYRDSL